MVIIHLKTFRHRNTQIITNAFPNEEENSLFIHSLIYSCVRLICIERPPWAIFWARSFSRHHMDSEIEDSLYLQWSQRLVREMQTVRVQWRVSGMGTKQGGTQSTWKRKWGAMKSFSWKVMLNLNSKGTHRKCCWWSSHISLVLNMSLQTQLSTASTCNSEAKGSLQLLYTLCLLKWQARAPEN